MPLPHIPINIRFDGAPNVVGSNIVRMPKLYQGAPYYFGFRIRFEDNTYRDFSTVQGARWRIKLRPSDSEDLMTLTMANGNFEVDTMLIENDTIVFVIDPSDWEGVILPRSPNHLETELPFAHTVEFLAAPTSLYPEGEVVERFAQGSGLISLSLG